MSEHPFVMPLASEGEQMTDDGDIERSSQGDSESGSPGPTRVDPEADDTGRRRYGRNIAIRVRIAGKELKELITGNKERHKRLHGRLLGLLTVSLLLDVVVALGLSFWDSFSDEEGRSLLRAFEWTTSQMLVGGSSYTAHTGIGHVGEVLLQVYGIVVIAAIAGSFASYFLSADAQ